MLITSNMKKLFASFLTFSILFSLGAFVVVAQQPIDSNPPPPKIDSNPINITLTNPFKTGDSLYDLIRAVVENIVLPIGGVIAVLALIYSGFLYVTAQGNQSKLDTAHKSLLYTAIGTAILLGSWVIANVIENTIKQLI